MSSDHAREIRPWWAPGQADDCDAVAGRLSARAVGARAAAGLPALRAGGFTLLEALVAFTALSLMLGAAYAAFGGGARGADAAANRLVALAAVESALATAAAAGVAGESETRSAGLVVRATAEPWPESPDLLRLWAEAAWPGGAVRLATLAPRRADPAR